MRIEILECRLQRGALRHQPEKIGTLAREHGFENLAGGVILVGVPRETVRKPGDRIRLIAIDGKRLRCQRPQHDGTARRERCRRDAAEVFLDLGDRGLGIDIAHDHVDRIVRMIVGVVQSVQLRRVDLRIEGVERSESVVAVRHSDEQVFEHLAEEFLRRLTLVLRHFVLDRATLDRPILLRQRQTLRARSLHAQQEVEIFRRRREEVLRDFGLRIGIPITAE